MDVRIHLNSKPEHGITRNYYPSLRAVGAASPRRCLSTSIVSTSTGSGALLSCHRSYSTSKRNEHVIRTPSWRLSATPVVTPTSWVTSLGAAFHANPIGFMTSVAVCIGAVALAGLLIAAIPALVSLKKTMDTAHVLLESLEEELPDAVAAIKLSGLEMADAMEEVSGLGSDLTAGIRASARALVGAEAGVREGAQFASGAVKKSIPSAKVAAEQALQKRASMTYSKETVADVARATKVASKRLRTALVAAQWAQNANRLLGP